MADDDIRVLVADDHTLFRDGLQALIDGWDGFTVVGSAAGGEEAVALCRSLAPDLVLMDVRMPEMSGVEATRLISASCPQVRVVMFGYQTWGYRTLAALLKSRHEMCLVVTHPASDHAYESIWADSVEDLAREAGIEVFLAKRPTPQLVDRVRELAPDVMVANNWRTKLPEELFGIPRYGTVNLHDSLLPQFTDPERGHVALQSLLLGLTHITVALTVNAVITVGAGSIAVFLARRPLWQRAQRYLMGSVLAGMALHLGLDRTRAVAAVGP